ncbi:MAG: Lrp/AsnC family transcriptional regulator [Pseudomonadota bacterium]|nr:Lrp/AsnC family transcriptional regulator [Pseudomonadota bacterium]
MSQAAKPRRGGDKVEGHAFDEVDRRILHILQREVDRPVTSIAEEVGLSPTPCWRRIKRLEETGVIRARVALVDQRLANVPMTVFISVKVPRHAKSWLTDFRALIEEIPQITEAYRLTGDVDYILKVVVPDIAAYDTVYKAMIERMDFSQISSSISMEELKFTTALPVDHL